MIFFIINNGYQLLDCRLHLAELGARETGLILIPHTLPALDGIHRGPTYVYQNEFNSGRLAYYRSLRRNRNRMRKEIAIGPGDAVVAYTEQEPLNQYCLERFRRAGAKVFLIEDCGPGTYLPFAATAPEPLNLGNRIRQTVLRAVLGLPGLRLVQINGLTFRWMPDRDVRAVFLYRHVALVRQIRAITIRRPAEPPVLRDPGVALFLNQDVYHDGMVSDEYYVDTLRAIVRQLADSFETVFFKYHPREPERWRQRIADEVLAGLTNVSVVHDVAPVETIVERIRPSLAISFMSSGLFNLAFRGVEPAFIYHLFPELAQQPYYQIASRVLTSIGYRFPRDAADLTPGFRSGIAGPNQASLSLGDAIDAN